MLTHRRARGFAFTRRPAHARWVFGSGLALVTVTVAAFGLAPAAGSVALPQTIPNPIRYDGHLFSCPDPDVFQLPGQARWIASCTSDYGQANPWWGRSGYERNGGAFPIYETKGTSFASWHFMNFIFPPGHDPDDALPAKGRWPGGRYWGDEIHQIGSNWVAYFSAQISPATLRRIYHSRGAGGRFGIFVAWTRDLFSGRWHSRLLHYPGQFNGVPGDAREVHGGVIDPSVARNPQTGALDIVWTKESGQILEAQLSPDGLSLGPGIHRAVLAKLPWMCHPTATGKHCVIEGPVLYADPVHPGLMDLFFNAAGTWNGTYKTGVAVSADPQHVKWTVYPHPIDHSGVGYGLQGPGIGAQPFTSPDGSLLMAVHLMTRATHDSQQRYLGFVHVNESGISQMLVHAGLAVDGPDARLPANQQNRIALSVPGINPTGMPEHLVTYTRRK